MPRGGGISNDGPKLQNVRLSGLFILQDLLPDDFTAGQDMEVVHAFGEVAGIQDEFSVSASNMSKCLPKK